MTTTLRPAGPEERAAGGGRSRPYEVCVNGRPVGSVRLTTDERWGPSVGRIARLGIDPADRRRGRATVAALASEEVLRGWGCRRIEVTVPAAAEGALRLARALGYLERDRVMAKDLGEAPALPAGSAGRPLQEGEYAAWRAAYKARQVRSRLDHGVPREQAEEVAEAELRAALPDGPATPGTALRVLTHHGRPVGALWIAFSAPGRPGGWVHGIEVTAGDRRRGHGRTLMLLAERACVAAGGHELGLRVFGDNAPALALCASLGYRTTEHHLYKPLL